ncbi:MAG: thioredoxin domain-containing protein [Alphaproteobacteria bacterium]|nr:thioredoxin domain-containing protein [Alphaproteobacteria bacterium]
MTENRLKDETSPYLRQHADNPVHWQPWDDQALDLAAQRNKPILLSIGYAACHWCHVMAHESFENQETAALMNELFINIKVDREERPDLDAIYQSALSLTGRQGGWPLTMFLTPQRQPFWGGTYFPPEPRYDMPHFRQVLRAIADLFETRADEVETNAASLQAGLHALSAPARGDDFAAESFDPFSRKVLSFMDSVQGGTRGAPKFPQVPVLEVLWRAWKKTADKDFHDAVILTLRVMCQGGIYDHLGGGFARYSTDEEWLVPHFEKMLYDNAQMAEIMTLVWRETRDPLLSVRVAETLDWVLRDMAVEGGAFAATIDADSPGGEGAFSVWDEKEIDGLLGDDSTFFKSVYDVSAAGNWEGRNILRRPAGELLRDDEDEARLARCREVLFQARAQREAPGRDDKVLADWNGLAIVALAAAGAVFENKQWVEAARNAFAFIRDNMVTGDRLMHCWHGGRARFAATLDDYASMGRAAVALFEISGDESYVEQAEEWVGILDRHYGDRENGGYFFTPDDATDLILRTRTAHDHATPSGNGMMAQLLAKLFLITGKDAYREKAQAILDAFAGEAVKGFPSLATLVSASDILARPLHVVIVGDRKDEKTQALIGEAYGLALPNVVLSVYEKAGERPQLHPLYGKQMEGGKPTAYVCSISGCTPPVTDAKELKICLEEMVQ